MNILLAIDGSACSDAAIHEIGRHTWPPQTHVRVVTVDGPLGNSTLGRTAGGSSAYEELVRRQRAEATDNLDRSASLLRQLAPQLNVSSLLLEGSPKEEIINEAERWGANLLVVGSHGHGAIKRMFLGSVSLAVATNAPCSVLIVRAQPQSDEATPQPR